MFIQVILVAVNVVGCCEIHAVRRLVLTSAVLLGSDAYHAGFINKYYITRLVYEPDCQTRINYLH